MKRPSANQATLEAYKSRRIDDTKEESYKIDAAVASGSTNCDNELDDEIDATDKAVVAELVGDLASLKRSSDLSDPAFDPSSIFKSDWAYYSGTGEKKKYDESEMLFEPLANAWSKVEACKLTGTGSKRKMITTMTNYFRVMLLYWPHQIVLAAYLSLHRLVPDYFGLEMGVGESIIIRSICEAYGRREAAIKKEIIRTGDLGQVAHENKVSLKTLSTPERLSLRRVYGDFKKIAEVKGANAQSRKKDHILRLLVSAINEEPKYIVRFLQQHLRIGMNVPSLLSSLAFTFCLSPPRGANSDLVRKCVDAFAHEGVPVDQLAITFRDIVVEPDVRRKKELVSSDLLPKLTSMELSLRKAYCQVPNIGLVLTHLLGGASEEDLADKCCIRPGVPVHPMLAKPSKSLSDILTSMEGQSFIAEYKYDGERLQVHRMKDGSMRLFSRNMEDLGGKYPDVINHFQECTLPESKDFILDTEVVAFDSETNQILPFQSLATRKRRDVNLTNINIKVCVFVFDCLSLNGTNLVTQDLSERRAAVQKIVKETPGKVVFAKGQIISEITELETLLQEAMDARTEGLMIKAYSGSRSIYEPSKRSVNWIKLKKDYLDNLGDSVDLVPIGAFWGRGKRNGVFGAFILATYDPDEEIYRSTCKLATGFSEQELATFHAELSEFILTTKPDYYHISDKLCPDVWIQPVVVWECKAADLSVSPIHTAGWSIHAPNKGIGLRFPRFIQIRPDKKPEQATTSCQIASMYQAQFK